MQDVTMSSRLSVCQREQPRNSGRIVGAALRAALSDEPHVIPRHPRLIPAGQRAAPGSEKGLQGRARCVVPGVSAAVAIAAWLGRALAVGVRILLGGLDVLLDEKFSCHTAKPQQRAEL